jgi:hypothetical protein
MFVAPLGADSSSDLAPSLWRGFLFPARIAWVPGRAASPAGGAERRNAREGYPAGFGGGSTISTTSPFSEITSIDHWRP